MRILAVDPLKVEFDVKEDFEKMRQIGVLLNRVKFSNDGCWLWQGWKDRDGYGQCQVANTRLKQRVHRYSYELFIGKIPDGLVIDHLCRVRHCLNPWHLEAVTVRENVLRGNTIPALHLAKHCCPKHNVDYVLRKAGYRDCLICKREAAKRAYRKKKLCES